MVEPPPPVRGRPVGGAGAPPGVDALRFGDEVTDRICPLAACSNILERLRFDRRVAYHIEELLVAPDIALIGRDVEVAGVHDWPFASGLLAAPAAHIGEKA